jgi:DNA-binding PadR family transcriptional regulator
MKLRSDSRKTVRGVPGRSAQRSAGGDARRSNAGARSDARGVSLLGYALLGLIRQAPASGYDLRRIFATTAMGSFSDSPGAIYPALARLERQGLIEGRVETSGLRQRQVFRVTGRGLKELKRWLARPIVREHLMHGFDEVMLRFAFMDGAAGREASQEFLRALVEALRPYIRELRAYLEEHETEMPLSGMLALECGIRGYEANLEWANHALEVYARAAKGGAR